MEQLKIIWEPADRFHLNAAAGWLGLGDFASALNELKQISAPLQTHLNVLMAQFEIYFAAEKWPELLPVAEKLLQRAPELDLVWIHRSYALHELKQTQAALDALLPAAKKFPKRWTIPYNLACYCSQLGRTEEALQWLTQAFALDGKKKIKAQALADPDFAPMRKAIRALK